MIKNINEWKSYKLNESSKKDIFNYKSVINDMWRPIIFEAQKFQKINFDLENNDSTNQTKIIYVKRNLRENQPVKYKFNVELCEAGGDWESPVMYFKIEFETDYNIRSFGFKLNYPLYVFDIKERDTKIKLNKCYVLIPGPEINHLTKTDKGGYTALDSGDKLGKITKEDHKKAWKWIEHLLNELVETRHEMLD